MTDTYQLILERETDSAWGVRADEDDELIWLPKSKVSRGRRIRSSALTEIWEFEIPDWLSEERGLA